MKCLILLNGKDVVEYWVATRVECTEWAWLWRWAGYAVWTEVFR